jgi:hypothetical protein
MDVLKAVQVYINKMITEVSGMKVLLLDAHTVCHTARQELIPDPYRLARHHPVRATST